MWSEKTEPLETWLVKNETVVESYEPIGYDISYVKGQSEDAQVSANQSPKSFFYIVLHFLNSQPRVIVMKVLFPIQRIPQGTKITLQKIKNIYISGFNLKSGSAWH